MFFKSFLSNHFNSNCHKCRNFVCSFKFFFNSCKNTNLKNNLQNFISNCREFRSIAWSFLASLSEKEMVDFWGLLSLPSKKLWGVKIGFIDLTR